MAPHAMSLEAAGSGRASSGRSAGARTDKWRFVVLSANFSMNFLAQGLLKAFGVLVPHLISKLNVDYGTIGFILSVEPTVRLIACPLVCMIAKRVNPRMLCILSSAGAGAAMAASAFVTSPIWFGVAMFFTGLLSSPTNQISVEVLHGYFGELLGAINSLCLLGCLFGGMIFPLLTHKLLQAYGLEGALLCLGAVFLHCVPIAATLRPAKGSLHKYKSASAIRGQDDSCRDSNQDSGDEEDEAHVGDSGESPEAQNMINAKECERSVCQFDSEELPSENGRDCIKELPQQADEARIADSPIQRLLHFVWVTLNIRVLYEEKWFTALILPCKFIVHLCMIAWTLFVVSFGSTKGLDESQATNLPTAGAIGGFVNQVVVTIIMSFRPHWGAPLFALEMAFLALAFFVYSLMPSFVCLWVCSFFIGGGIFGGSPITYALLITYVSEENFAVMLSTKLFVMGVSTAVGGYMAGALYDVTGSFDSVFMIMGGSSAVAFLLTLSLMLVKRMEKARTESN